MGQKIKQDNDQKGRSLEENLEKLEESGLLGDKEEEKEKQVPETKEQQKTGDTERSDRRL